MVLASGWREPSVQEHAFLEVMAAQHYECNESCWTVLPKMAKMVTFTCLLLSQKLQN